jgi:2-polyprenyl-3-methyl-5-hydroxy-6-metoxy-1,4-benzoquinol methylase
VGSTTLAEYTVHNAVDWHDSIADRFDDGYRRSSAFIERAALWQAKIDDHVPMGGVVLDAGCGSGVFSFMAAERAQHVDAIDGSAQMIAIARREQQRRGLLNIDFAETMLDQLPRQPAAHYDAILSSSVLEYVENIADVLGQFNRLLKPGGTLIISMPNARSFYRKAERLAFQVTGRPRYFRHVHHVVSTDAMAAMLSEAGLQIIDPPSFFADPPLPAIFTRLASTPQRRKSLFLLIVRSASHTPAT